MKVFDVQKTTYMALAWMLIISMLTVVKAAPDDLNADTIMHSVMSLQNLTMYYWGQNRLLNALPFAATLVKNPTLNLAVILMLASISLYGLLYLLSRSSAILLGLENVEEISLKVFLITSSAFVFIFSSHALYEIAIGHIEYSFPSLLLVFSVLKIYSKANVGGGWRRLILPLAAIILAIGLNPSTVIPVFFITVAIAFYKKSFRSNELLLLLASGVAFFAWDFVSKQYGNLPYHEFRLEILYSGLQKVIEGLLSTLNLSIIFIFIAIISIRQIVFRVYKISKNYEPHFMIASYVTNAAVLFSIAWIFLFSSSRWVAMNQYEWRYFIYVIFALIFLCTLHLTLFLRNKNDKKSQALTGVAAFSALIFLVIPIPKLDFSDYKIFQRVNELTEPGSRLYSGDYWMVWPSVLRDMMKGYEAYGLTHRGEANKEAAREFVLRAIKENGRASVHCLNDTIQNCISQVNSTAGPLHVVGSSDIKAGVSLVNFVDTKPSSK